MTDQNYGPVRETTTQPEENRSNPEQTVSSDQQAASQAAPDQAVLLPFPANWTDAMRSMFLDRWIPYCQAKRGEPVSLARVDEQIQQAAHLTEQQLEDTINHSIKKNYLLLFPERFETWNPDGLKASPPDDDLPEGMARLPRFMARHTQNHNASAGLKRAIKDVFWAFYRTDQYQAIEELEKLLSYNALEQDLLAMVETATRRQAGAAPDKEVVTPADMEENPFQPEAYEVYQQNPLNYTDVEYLQKWIFTLQEMSKKQCAVINVCRRVDSLQKKLIEEQRSAIETKEALIAALEKAKQVVRIKTRGGVVLAPKPKQQNWVSLSLSFNSIGGASEVTLLQRALGQYRDERLKQALLDIRYSDADEAFAEYNDYEMVKGLLDSVSELNSAVESPRRLVFKTVRETFTSHGSSIVR